MDLSKLFQGASSHCQLDMGAAIFVALAALGGPLTLSRGSRGVLRRSRRLYLAAARPSKAASARQQAGTSAIRKGQAMQLNQAKAAYTTWATPNS
jgi:hypothetical protein